MTSRALTFAEELGALRRTFHRALVRKLAREVSRPFLQLQALRLIALEEVHTQAELAERLLIDAPAASRLVSKLAAEKLIKRCTGSDRRCVALELTARARSE